MPKRWEHVRPHLADLARDLTLGQRMNVRAARVRVRRFRAAAASGTRDVVLIPGVWESRYFLDDLGEHLREAGYRVHDVPGLLLCVPRVELLADRVRRRMDELGVRRTLLVAHSKGGLVGKRLLVDPRSRGRIEGLVALSTPWHGSSWADVMPPAMGLRALRPASPMVRDLDRRTDVNARIVSIYGSHDMHIPEGCRLAGARRNIQVESTGHFLPLAAPGFADIVLEALASWPAAVPGPKGLSRPY